MAVCLRIAMCLLALHVVGTQSEGTLRKVQVVFRHGMRHPLKIYWNDSCINSYTADQFGNLTESGRKQMRTLGRYLRSRYHDFIGADSSKVQTVTTGSHRTLESARMVAQGLFDNFTNSAMETIQLDRNLQGPLFTRKGYFTKWIEAMPFKNDYQGLCDRLDSLPDLKCRGMSDLVFLFDQMNCELADGCVLPSWLDQNLQTGLQDLFAELVIYGKMCSSRQVVREHSDELMKKINNLFNPEIEDDKKLYLFALHDINLELLKTRIGAYYSPPAAFGAVLIFEQHSIGGQNFIRTFYDCSQDYTGFHQLKVARCDPDCPYQDFHQISTGPNLCYNVRRPQSAV